MIPPQPPISRRSFLRTSAAVTASAILGGLTVKTVYASPSPPPTSFGGASVVKPAYHNIQSVEMTITWTITWLMRGGGTQTVNVIEVVPAGGTAPSRTIYEGDAIMGTISALD